MKRYLFILSLASLTAAGCAETSSATQASAAPAPVEITRDAAITTARRDAASHFSFAPLPGATASLVGSYWVIELRAPDGRGLRYAVARDGMIRERRMTQ